MVDCSSGLARWLRSVVNIERKDSVVTTEPDTTDTSSSQESLDSGFVELSETAVFSMALTECLTLPIIVILTLDCDSLIQ